MAGITASGIGSGLDISGLVSQLVAAERQPTEARLNKVEAGVNAKLSAFGQFRNALASVRDIISKLADGQGFDSRSASSANAAVLTVSANDSAQVGTYSIQVDQLAQGQQRTSGVVADTGADIGTGSLTIDLGGDSFSVSLSSGNASLVDFRNAINNASDNPGVSAVIINSDAGAYLRLTSDRAGDSSVITLTPGGDADANLTSFVSGLAETQVAQNASIFVDGFQVTSSSNTVTSAIDGVTLDLLAADPGNPFNVTVERSDTSLVKTLESFVSAYNKFVDTTASLSSYDAGSGTAAALSGDSTLRSAVSQLRQALTADYGSGDYASLLDLGFSTNVKGRLSFDSDKFEQALSGNFNAVKSFFADSGKFGGSLETLANQYLNSTGLIASRETGLRSQLDQVADGRDQLDLRMERLQSRYLAQFTALDSLLGQLQQTSSFLSQQLSSLANLNNRG